MSSTRLRRTAVVVTLGVLTLAGCGTTQAGAASVVGSESVSDADVATVVNEIRTQAAAASQATFDERATTLATLSRETRHLLLEQAVLREGLVVTQGDVDTFINQVVTTSYSGDRAKLDQDGVTKAGIPASEITQYFRDLLIQRALGAKLAPGADPATTTAKNNEYLAKLGKEFGVVIAPRFGTWDYAQSAVVPSQGDLTVPQTGPSLVPNDPGASAPVPAPSAS